MLNQLYLYILLVAAHSIPSVISYKPSKQFCKDIKAACNLQNAQHQYCHGVTKQDPEMKKLEPVGTIPRRVPLSESMKQTILDLHNSFRNELACDAYKFQNIDGSVFEGPLGMSELTWDEELEWSAELSASKCNKLTECLATDNYIFMRQNVASQSATCSDYEDFVLESIRNWFLEYLVVDVKIEGNIKLSVMPNMSKFYTDEHFFHLMDDFAVSIGCALYSCGPVKNSRYSYYFVCNYGHDIEVKDIPKKIKEKKYWQSVLYPFLGSQCEQKSFKYNCLCDPMVRYVPRRDFCEKIDPRCREIGLRHLHCIPESRKTSIFDDKFNIIKAHLNESLKQNIVHWHNQLRSRLADGFVQNSKGEVFPRAAKISEIVWDDELEWNAEVTLRECASEKLNYCPISENFLDAVINRAFKLRISSPENYNFQKIHFEDYTSDIYSAIQKWWGDYKHLPASSIDTFKSESVNNFAAMASDNIMKIGCSIFYCPSKEKYKMELTFLCNYGYSKSVSKPKGHIREKGHPIYKKSDECGSECRIVSQNYRCLCIDFIEEEVCQCDCHVEKDRGNEKVDEALNKTTTSASKTSTKVVPTTSKVVPTTSKVVPTTSKIVPTSKVVSTTSKVKPTTSKHSTTTPKNKISTSKEDDMDDPNEDWSDDNISYREPPKGRNLKVRKNKKSFKDFVIKYTKFPNLAIQHKKTNFHSLLENIKKAQQNSKVPTSPKTKKSKLKSKENIPKFYNN